jgi:hypothetical protein
MISGRICSGRRHGPFASLRQSRRLAGGGQVLISVETIFPAHRMTQMKTHFTGLVTGLAIAALLVIAPTLPGYAEDAAPATSAAPTPAPAEAPASVPRPSLAPKAAEPAAPQADTEPAPRSHRRYAHRHHRYGYYRTAYWEPFPIFWPHFYHNRVHWNRIPWLFRF